MADWIKGEKTWPYKPEIIKIARLLNISRREAFALHFEATCWLDGVCVDGVVDGVTSTDVDALLQHVGFSKAICDTNWWRFDARSKKLFVVNFQRHNGESAKARSLKSERQAKWRHSKSAGGAGGPKHVDVVASTREEKRRDKISKGLSRIGATQDQDQIRPQIQTTSAWWSTLESMVAQAAKYGLVANTGESRDDFYQRIKFAMKRKG